MRKLSSLMLVLLIAVTTVYAGGYQVRLQGQQQTTMGLIGTPLVFGSSGIFYNPGTLSFMETTYDFSAGVSILKSNATFQKDFTNYQAKTHNPLKPPFSAYGAYKINDKFAVGIGVYTPYGSTANWDDDWAGRMLVQNISLKAIYVQPTVSYKISEDMGIGIGLVYATGDVKLQRGLPYSDDSKVNLNGKTSSWGFNVGFYYKISDQLTFGASYRSKIKMKLENGDATFTIPQSLGALVPPSGTFNADLPMPANLDVGIAYKFDEKLTLAAEINYVFWSAYKSLDFTSTDVPVLNSSSPREYSNSLIMRIGGEYKLNDKITLRAGAYYDPSPTSDIYFSPETVSLNTIAFTFGATYDYSENLQFTVSYLQTNGMETSKSYAPANFSGKYQTVAYIPGFGIRYRF